MKQQNSKGERDAVMEVASVVINNQATAEENAIRRANEHNDRLKLTLTLRQILLIIIVLSTIGRATSGRWWFDYKTEGELNRRLAEETLRADIAERDNKWLWHSHGELNALLEDDPKLLTSEAWNFFLKHGTSRRVEGFKRIIEDGHHPRMKQQQVCQQQQHLYPRITQQPAKQTAQTQQ